MVYIDRPLSYKDYIKSKPFQQKKIKWGNPNTNKNPPRHSTLKKSEDKLYIMIFDTEFQANKYQCIAKQQWVDPLSTEDFIDGIEFYSHSTYTNWECNISTIVPPQPPEQFMSPNPSSWVISKALEMYLSRSDSGWVLLIGDAAYIDVEKFKDFFKHFKTMKDPLRKEYASGGCIEERYFFYMLILDSGILLSRKGAERVLETFSKNTWEVAYQIGLNGEEALSQIFIHNLISPQGSANDLFLGREFVSSDDLELLSDITVNNMPYKINTLPQCIIPKMYYSIRPGESNLCSYTVTPLNQIIIWSGSGKYQSKLEFLTKAPKILQNIPPILSYYWSPVKPKLCRNV